MGIISSFQFEHLGTIQKISMKHYILENCMYA